MSETQQEPPQTIQGGHPPTQHPHGAAAVFLKLMGTKPMEGGEIAEGVTRILSGYSSAYLVSASPDNGEYILIDSGADAKAEEIEAVLRYKGVDTSAVKAIFLTHGHSDHTAGAHLFTDAEVYVGADDHAFVEGTGASDGFLPHLMGKQPNLAVGNPDKLHRIQNGETVTVGTKQVRAFAVPGHTRGSTAYLVDGALFVGDAVTFGPDGKAQKPPKPVSHDVPQGVESLSHLLAQLDAENIQVRTIVPGHSGEGDLQAVRDLVA